jgi:hypothetical protein
MELLGKAIRQLADADADGRARLSEVGKHVLILVPDFDTRSYGCKKLSGLVTMLGQFEIRRNAAKNIFVRPAQRSATGNTADPPDIGPDVLLPQQLDGLFG